LFAPLTGLILFITFLSSSAHNAAIIGFQAHLNDVLKLDAFNIGLIFAVVGIVSVFMQAIGIRLLLKTPLGMLRLIRISLFASALALTALFNFNALHIFIILTVFYVGSFTIQGPLLSSMLSNRTKAEDQGGILGINQAYLSLGQIAGPLLAGIVVAHSVSNIFLLAGSLMVISALVSFKTKSAPNAKLDL